jgi:hypothetical protein
MWRSHPATALLCAGALSCARTPAPAKTPAAARRPDATLVYSQVPLSSAAIAAGVLLPSPLVKGTVAGHATMMIVDTGAHIPVVSSWLAQDAGLPIGESFSGHDAAGRPVPMRRCDRPALVIEGWGAVADAPLAIVELPDAFRRIGVGAVVSPQALVTGNDVVVLDLALGHMQLVPLAEAPLARRNADEFVLRDAHQCSYDSNGAHGLGLVATVTIDGSDVSLDLDTGTNGITIGRTTELGKRLATRPKTNAHGLGAAGDFDGLRVDDILVRLGDFEMSTSVTLVVGAANAACGSSGRFGMDLLRGCVLVIGDKTLTATCHPPPISTASPRCDACMQAKCREQANVCQKLPVRCNAFSTCAKACTSRSCIDDCAAKAPEGMALNRCLNDTCGDACGP